MDDKEDKGRKDRVWQYTNQLLVEHIAEVIMEIDEGETYESQEQIYKRLGRCLTGMVGSFRRSGRPYPEPRLEDMGLADIIFAARNRDKAGLFGLPPIFECIDAIEKYGGCPSLLHSTITTLGFVTYNNLRGTDGWFWKPTGPKLLAQLIVYAKTPKPCFGKVEGRDEKSCEICEIEGLCRGARRHITEWETDDEWRKWIGAEKFLRYFARYAVLTTASIWSRLIGCWRYKPTKRKIVKNLVKARS